MLSLNEFTQRREVLRSSNMAYSLDILAENENIPFSEIDFAAEESPELEVELSQVEEPSFGRFVYDKGLDEVQATLDFDIVLEQDCQRVLEDAIVDENVDVYSLDMSGVVFRLMEKLEPALDDFTDLNLAAMDSTASMGMFTFSYVFGMDECLGDLREELDKISQFLWLQEDESRALAFEAFREEFPEIELR